MFVLVTCTCTHSVYLDQLYIGCFIRFRLAQLLGIKKDELYELRTLDAIETGEMNEVIHWSRSVTYILHYYTYCYFLVQRNTIQ